MVRTVKSNKIKNLKGITYRRSRVAFYLRKFIITMKTRGKIVTTGIGRQIRSLK